jgi:REP element-mobilizing transposase RayT
MPDHLHAIWTLPDGDPDFATRWRLIKSGFSRALPRTERISASRAAKVRTSSSARDQAIHDEAVTIHRLFWQEWRTRLSWHQRQWKICAA